MAEDDPTHDDPAHEGIAAAGRSVARETRRARLGIGAERAARLLWPLWAVIAGFLGLALLGAPQALPFAAHLAVLGAFGAGALFFLVRAALRWRTPTLAEARARLDLGARDRPVAALSDALSAGAGDPAARSVWAAHRVRRRAPRWRARRARTRASTSATRAPCATRRCWRSRRG
jgi:hypothetical protein